MNYPRSGISSPESTPKGWLHSAAARQLEGSVDVFDRLAGDLFELRALRAVGISADWVDREYAMRVFQVGSGPFRGLYRVVEVIDEVLTQGVVIGTGAGNPSTAEYRTVLDFDPTSGRIDVMVRAVWLPSRRHLLPGGAARESRRQCDFVRGLARCVAGER